MASERPAAAPRDPLGTGILVVAAVILLVAPLPYGSVSTGARTALGIAVLALFVVSSAREALGKRHTFDPAIAFIASCIGIVALYGLAQTIPLPSGVLARLSPAANALYLAVVPGYADAAAAGEALGPVSIAPLETWLALAHLMACLALFLVVAREARTDRRIVFLAGAIVLAGLLEAGYGIFRHATPDTTIAGITKAQDQGGATGSFFNRNHFAGYLGMAAMFSVGLIFGAQREGERRWVAALGARRTALTVCLALVTIILATAIALSLSRSAIASVGGACLALALLLGRKRGWKFALSLAVLIALGGALAASQSLDRIVARFGQTTKAFEYGREGIWTRTASMIADHPIAGVGLGAYEASFERYRPVFEIRQLRVEHAHNDYIEALAELGVLGSFPLALAALATAYTLVRRWLRRQPPLRARVTFGCLGALLYVAMHSLTDFNLHVPAFSLAFAAIAGLGLAASRSEEGQKQTVRGRVSVLLPHAILILAAASAMAFGMYVLKADRIWPLHPGAAQKEELALMETDAAIGRLRAARDVLPAHAGYHLAIGRLLVRKADPPGGPSGARTSRLEDARASFSEALSRNPGYIPALTHMASAEFALGRVDDAIAHHRGAMALAPNDYYAAIRYSIDVVTYLPAIPPGMRALYLISAEEEMQRGIALNHRIKWNPTVLRRMIDIYLLNGKPDEALRLLKTIPMRNLDDLHYTLARAEILVSAPETRHYACNVYIEVLKLPGLVRSQVESIAASIEKAETALREEKRCREAQTIARAMLADTAPVSGKSAVSSAQ